MGKTRTKEKTSKQLLPGSPMVGSRRSHRTNQKDSLNSHQKVSRKASWHKTSLPEKSRTLKTRSSTSSIRSQASGEQEPTSRSVPDNVILRGRATYVSMVTHKRSLPTLLKSGVSSDKESNTPHDVGTSPKRSTVENRESISLTRFDEKNATTTFHSKSKAGIADCDNPVRGDSTTRPTEDQPRAVRLASRDSLPSLDSPTLKLPSDETFAEEKRENSVRDYCDGSKKRTQSIGDAMLEAAGKRLSLSSRDIREHERDGGDLYSSPSSSSSGSSERLDIALMSSDSSNSLVSGDTDDIRSGVGAPANQSKTYEG